MMYYVNSYLENEIAVETFEGKNQMKKNEVKAQQLDLFEMFF